MAQTNRFHIYIQSFKFGSGIDRNNKNAINDLKIANSSFTYVEFIKYSWIDIYVRRIYGRVTIAKLPQRAKS